MDEIETAVNIKKERIQKCGFNFAQFPVKITKKCADSGEMLAKLLSTETDSKH